MLKFVKRLDGSYAPPSYTEARTKALAEARAYSTSHDLSVRESSILEYYAHASALKSAYEPTWKQEILSDGLQEIERYRDKATMCGADYVQHVRVIEAGQWQPEWVTEGRLSIAFEPVAKRVRDYPTRSIQGALRIRNSLNHIVPIKAGLDFQPAEAIGEKLYQINLFSREEPFLWKGSEALLHEGISAVSYTHSYSALTPVTATVTLAAVSFDFIFGIVERCQQSIDENQRLRLIIGFPFQGQAIPRGRPVKADEMISDAVRIDQQTPRLWTRLDSIDLNGSDFGHESIYTIGQWMLVEPGC